MIKGKNFIKHTHKKKKLHNTRSDKIFHEALLLTIIIQ